MTTLTKRMAEELTQYLAELGIKVRYLHSDVETLERVEIVTAICGAASSTCWSASTCCARGSTCRRCRWWRSSTPTRRASCAAARRSSRPSGRAARNLNGRVIFYADRVTDSMRRAIDETERRRRKQEDYNQRIGIEPRTILKDIHSPLVAMSNLDYYSVGPTQLLEVAEGLELPLAERISKLEKEMKAAAKRLEFEEAAALRDRLRELREIQIYAG